MDGAVLRNARFASNKRIDLARDEAAVSSTSHRAASSPSSAGLRLCYQQTRSRTLKKHSHLLTHRRAPLHLDMKRCHRQSAIQSAAASECAARSAGGQQWVRLQDVSKLGNKILVTSSGGFADCNQLNHSEARGAEI